MLPPGLPVKPASLPSNKLFVPLVTETPALFPSAVLLSPVQAVKVLTPIAVQAPTLQHPKNYSQLRYFHFLL